MNWNVEVKICIYGSILKYFKIKVQVFEFRFSLEYFLYATAILKLNVFQFYVLFYNISEYVFILR